MSRRGLSLAVLASSTALVLALGAAGPASAAARPRPIVHADDQIDWYFGGSYTDDDINAGDTVNAQLRVANGVTGARGYSLRRVPAQGFKNRGNKTVLDFGTETDDGTVKTQLPFKFPFAGFAYRNAHVSTNGWMAFGQPAWDYYDDTSPTPTETAQFFRGLFPYWADLMLNDIPGQTPADEEGRVRRVIPPDRSYVAVQWIDLSTYSETTPERNLQVILFRNGNIRFDYPRQNADGGNDNLIGLSGGLGNRTYVEVARENLKAPNKSLLFTPRPLGAAERTRRGNVTLTIPDGDAGNPDPFVDASQGCTLTIVPTATTDGLVKCRVPRLGPGGQKLFNVSWIYEESVVTDLEATYTTGGRTVKDLEQTESL